MTIISLILGIIATALPKILDILSQPKKEIQQEVSYVPDLLDAETEEDVEISWANHDADIERLL